MSSNEYTELVKQTISNWGESDARVAYALSPKTYSLVCFVERLEQKINGRLPMWVKLKKENKPILVYLPKFPISRSPFYVKQIQQFRDAELFKNLKSVGYPDNVVLLEAIQSSWRKSKEEQKTREKKAKKGKPKGRPPEPKVALVALLDAFIEKKEKETAEEELRLLEEMRREAGVPPKDSSEIEKEKAHLSTSEPFGVASTSDGSDLIAIKKPKWWQLRKKRKYYPTEKESIMDKVEMCAFCGKDNNLSIKNLNEADYMFFEDKPICYKCWDKKTAKKEVKKKKKSEEKKK